MNKPITPEHWLQELIDAKLDGPEFNRIIWTDADTQQAKAALQALNSRMDEIAELNKLTTKLDAEIGTLRSEIEARNAELQDAWKYEAEAEAALAKRHIDSINREYVFHQIDCVEFAIECAHDGPNEEYALYRVAMEAIKRLRNCLTVYDDSASDIPF